MAHGWSAMGQDQTAGRVHLDSAVDRSGGIVVGVVE